MKNVLITAIGSFSADIAIKTCKEELGYRVIGCDIYPMEWIAQSLDVDVFYQAPYAVDEEKYMDFITKLIKEEEINFILPSTDVEVDVLTKYRDLVKNAGATLCISGAKTIERCRNKMEFAEFVKDICTVIPTQYVKDVKEPELPCIVKPVNGRSSIGLKKITNSAEYTLADPDSLVQPYIEGSIITCDVVRHPKSGYTEVLAREELLRTPNGAGTSVKIIKDWELEEVCRDLAEKLQIRGCVCFEFIKDAEGKYHILECNPRLSGGVAFSVLAGYNFVKAHFECFDADDIEVKSDIPEMYIARKYQEYMT